METIVLRIRIVVKVLCFVTKFAVNNLKSAVVLQKVMLSLKKERETDISFRKNNAIFGFLITSLASRKYFHF